jgi:hypothetical protein
MCFKLVRTENRAFAFFWHLLGEQSKTIENSVRAANTILPINSGRFFEFCIAIEY